MPVYKLTLAYDGTSYQGWQVQPGADTIQKRVEEALTRMAKSGVSVVAAGRTDAGVHAWGQVAHARVDPAIPEEGILKGLNAMLPSDIRVRSVASVEDDFHARYSARGKTYRYYLDPAPVALPFRSRFTLHHPYPLEREALEAGAALFIGEHDFAGFRAASCNAKTTRRELLVSRWLDDGGELVYEVSGTGFLQHMIRNMVGTLLEIGRGKRSIASIDRLFQSGDRTQAGPTASPKGLHLMHVDYDS